MKIRTPKFWQRKSQTPNQTHMARLSTCLTMATLLPLSWGYGGLLKLRPMPKRIKAELPCVCVGNLTAGGSGKTPVVLALAAMLIKRGEMPHILTRGYGRTGDTQEPICVNPDQHRAEEVGDEALLLAQRARSAVIWSGADRIASAKLARESGATCLICDDGFQSEQLHFDLSFIVVDGAFGFGNGQLLPAGPLREPIEAGLARADGVIWIEAEPADIFAAKSLASRARSIPIMNATISADQSTHLMAELSNQNIVAFAGIGRPEKFFKTLAAITKQIGANLVETYEFPDHYRLKPRDLSRLYCRAKALDARLVTTEKDHARLDPEDAEQICALSVALNFSDPQAVATLLDRVVTNPAHRTL